MRASLKPVLAVLGIGIIVLGVYLLARIVWLGGSEIVIGLLALLALASRPRSARHAAAVLGATTLLLWVVAVAQGHVGWLSSLTFFFGVAFIVAAAAAYRVSLPPGRGSGFRQF